MSCQSPKYLQRSNYILGAVKPLNSKCITQSRYPSLSGEEPNLRLDKVEMISVGLPCESPVLEA
jgi:hypothetical protein